jgi:hypothetical protein
VTAEGKAEVVRATEVPGELILDDQPSGNFIYEAARGEKTVAVQAIPDPFERRSFTDLAGPHKGEGHHIERAKSADVIIKVPNTNLTNAGNLSLRLFKIKPGGRPIERIDVATVDAVKQAKGLETHFELVPETVASQIKKVGKKLEVHAPPPK